MKFLLLATAVFLGSTAAHAARSTCQGSNGIDTLPDCDGSNEGLACALDDGDTFQIYVCKQGNWTPAPAPSGGQR